MPLSFQNQLARVCQRRHRRYWFVATCWTLVTTVLAVLALMAFDRVLGIADPVGRILLTVTFIGLCLAIFRRWLHTITKKQVAPLQVAYEIEQQHPELKGMVANAWEFGQQADNDPTAGSGTLRRAVVLRAATLAESIDWQQLVPRNPTHQALLGLAGVGLVVSLLGWCLPQAMEIGLLRLTNPFNKAEWPRQHNLQFVEPIKLLAVGDDLVLQLHDAHGNLPESIAVHYRTYRQGRWQQETQELSVATNMLEIRRPNVRESLEFRATGGDHHTMPWQKLEVVEPPRIESWQLTVHPPDYTGLPIQRWKEGTPIYIGSRLELQGHADQAVTQVSLQNAQGEEWLAQLDPTGKKFRIESSVWQIEKSQSVVFHMTTATGLDIRTPTTLSLEIIADQPPKVRFIQPTNDLQVLPTVVLPLEIEATDEFALQKIELAYQYINRQETAEQKILLWKTNQSNVEQQHRVDFLWELQELSLQPGDLLEVCALATDAQPVTGQSSRVLHLSIVSEDTLWQQIIAQQVRIVETLAELLRTQRDLHSNTNDWQSQPKWLPTRWANATHAALFRQRQITDTLSSGSQSLLARLATLSETLRRNNILRLEAIDRLQAAQELLEGLVEGPLASTEQRLSQVVRQSQRILDGKKLNELLAITNSQQEAIIVGLRQAIDLLSPGNALGQIERELAVLKNDQIILAEHCQKEIAPRVFQSLESESNDLLADAVRRQRKLAGRFAELVLNMSQTVQRIADQEPALAARVTDTMEHAVQLNLQVNLQAAADQLSKRRLGRSGSLQQIVSRDLEKLLARLIGSNTLDIAERFEQLQAAERKVERLRRQVASLEKKIQQLSAEKTEQELQRLRRERERLAKQTDELTRQLERLRMPRAADAAKKAVSELRRVKLDTETTKAAKKQLETVKEQLTEQRRRQQVKLARLQMAQLDAKLKILVGQQKSIHQELLRLDDLKNTSRQLSAAQQQSVLLLMERQADLLDEVNIQAETLVSLPVFTHLLQMSAETMLAVKRQLENMELGPTTQGLTSQAIEQLTQLAVAVRQEKQDLAAEKPQNDGAGQGGSGSTAEQQTLQLNLGQLKLLKSLQAKLRAKTQAFETQLATGQETTDSAAELARQQQQLVELAKQLVPEPPDPAQQEKPFPDLEQELERSLDEVTLP